MPSFRRVAARRRQRLRVGQRSPVPPSARWDGANCGAPSPAARNTGCGGLRGLAADPRGRLVDSLAAS
jgi:hypothetical protein